MKLVTIIGARPQFIKAAPVSRAFADLGVAETLVDTGQHCDDNLSRVFVRELEMTPPAYELGLHGGSHAVMIGRMLPDVERVLEAERPDAVLVYGDTNSTLSGALTAAKLNLPVAHVEAGLRSYRTTMPEEVNRRLVDHMSTLLFCPTPAAVENLEHEGIGGPKDRLRRVVCEVGDVMVDALRMFAGRDRPNAPPPADLPEGGYALVTAHRAETTADSAILENLVVQLTAVARTLPVVMPLHPRTRKSLAALGVLERLEAAPNLHVLPPMGYLDFTAALRGARVTITDSGGVQKEAAVLGAPCLTMRTETEWPETVDSGWNRIIGRKPSDLPGLVAACKSPDSGPLEIYGDGHASRKIAERLSEWWTKP